MDNHSVSFITKEGINNGFLWYKFFGGELLYFELLNLFLSIGEKMENFKESKEAQTIKQQVMEEKVTLTGLDKIAYNLDQPITWKGFIAKGVVNGVIVGLSATATKAAVNYTSNKVKASLKRGDHLKTPPANSFDGNLDTGSFDSNVSNLR